MSEMIGSASASEYESEFWMSLMVAMKVKLRATSESDAAHVFMRRRKRSIGENSRLTHSARWARRAKQLTGGDTRHDAWAYTRGRRQVLGGVAFDGRDGMGRHGTAWDGMGRRAAAQLAEGAAHE
jgi:hypothetical protein